MATSRCFARRLGATFMILAGLAAPATAVETPVFTVEGFVVDASGAPIADAEVRFAPDRDRLESTLAAISDDEGAFAIEVTRAGAAGRLTVEKEGFAPTLIDRIPPLSRRVALGPVALHRGRKLDGVVSDERGEPIAGSRVQVALEPDELFFARAPVVVATSAADGSFSVPDLPPARLFVQIEAVGRVAAAEWVDLRGATDGYRFDVRLASGSPHRGKVKAEDGSPIADATIERAGSWLGGVRRTTTAADGSFEWPSTGVRDERFVARARGFAPTTLVADQIGSGVVTLRTGVRIEASLTEASGTATQLIGIAYDVFVRHGEGWKHEDGMLSIDDVRVSESGKWTGALPPGDRARVRLRGADGRETTPIDLDLGTPPEGGFVVAGSLPPLQTLHGRVVGPTGQPIPDLRVEIGAPNEASLHPRAEQAALTDADGRFAIEGVRPGSWSLMANSDDVLSNPRLVAVTATSAPEAIELSASLASRVRGSLKIGGAPPGRRIAMVGLRYQRIGAGGQHVVALSTHCGDDGGYALSPLPPGALVVAPLRPPEPLDGAWHDYRAWIDGIDVKNSPNRTNALDPGQLHLDVAVDFAKRGVVEGRVTVNGAPRPYARLGLRKKPIPGTVNPTLFAPGIVMTDARGRFRSIIEGGGDFEIALFDTSLRAERSFGFEEGSRLDLEIAIEAGTVSGRIEAAATSPGPIRVGLESAITTEEERLRRANPSNLDDTPWVSRVEVAVAEDGSYHFGEVTAGEYRVAVEDVSRTLARVASRPFQLTAKGVEVPPIAVPAGNTLLLSLEKDPSIAERLPFASAKVVAAEGEPPLDRTFVGWFVGPDAKVEGLPAGKVRVEIVVFGNWQKVSAQEFTIDPANPEHRISFRVAPMP